MMRKLCAVAALVSVLTACAHVELRSADLLIRHATIVDVASGTLLQDREIAIASGNIVAISQPGATFAYNAANVVDAHGQYVIPGLWDMHVHFGGGPALIEENRDLLPLYVAHGITTVRDCAGDISDSVLAWRGQIARGELQGPTLYTSGPKIEGKGSIWPGDLEVANEAELLAAFDQLQALHVDFIKITDSALSPDLFLAALKEANRRGLKTSAHIPMSLMLDDVSAAGLGSIEHMPYALKAASSRERELAAAHAAGKLDYRDALAQSADSIDHDIALAQFRRLAARGTAITPTLYGSRVVAYLDQDDHRGDDYLHYIGPSLKATYAWRVERAAKDDAAAIATRHKVYERSAALLPLLQQAGVSILAGTDAGFLNSFDYPGIGLHDELGEFVKYGLTPLQALQAATLHGARFLGKQEHSGSVEVGKVADLVLLERNPLQDISATRAIAGVALKGQYLDRAALDAMLAGVRARVAEREQAQAPH
jgi:imidazolonepropionase-like amidohydrolase